MLAVGVATSVISTDATRTVCCRRDAPEWPLRRLHWNCSGPLDRSCSVWSAHQLQALRQCTVDDIRTNSRLMTEGNSSTMRALMSRVKESTSASVIGVAMSTQRSGRRRPSAHHLCLSWRRRCPWHGLQTSPPSRYHTSNAPSSRDGALLTDEGAKMRLALVTSIPLGAHHVDGVKSRHPPGAKSRRHQESIGPHALASAEN